MHTYIHTYIHTYTHICVNVCVSIYLVHASLIYALGRKFMCARACMRSGVTNLEELVLLRHRILHLPDHPLYGPDVLGRALQRRGGDESQLARLERCAAAVVVKTFSRLV